MKNILKIFVVLGAVFLLSNCTDDFNEINTKPDSFTVDEVSAKYFLTTPQYKLYAPDRFPYWRAHLIHADRYSGQVCFGHSSSWWSDELGYAYSSGYTDAAWDWLSSYIGDLDNFMRLTATGGEFENEKMYAIGQIIKGLYFQMFTDVFGMVPYSEATNPDIVLPKFDEQSVIYEGIIAELDEAIATIGDATSTGVAVDDVADNDIYCGGDLQQWKRLANTLKLRIGMRAYGAAGAGFAESAISSALNSDLLDGENDNILMEKDEEISQWGSACYGDVWYNFGAGSDWTMSKTMIDLLRDNNDPRLAVYAQPAVGGTQTLEKPTEGSEVENFQKRVDFIFAVLDEAGVEYTTNVLEDGSIEVTMPENMYYVGQPTRLNGKMNSFARYNFFSKPAEVVINKKNNGEIRAELIMSSAESYFLQAEAAVMGMGAGSAQDLYQEGIRQAMKLWGVSDADIDTYLANEDMAMLTGTDEEKLEKIASQRWIAAFTDGFEAWAIVRDMGYPVELAAGVEDGDIFGLGDINGNYPERMRYGNGVINTNGENYNAAVAIQGADVQDTKLWWAKQ
ncbi:SusD/RagB family nutrient-binding outer membrane lipoprotein [uncultured Draconibacterium sp.]|uniref:SusD/RagB family nutrient-binding outer membrane lipoprotein n=1 Tax=uncultured Draconibacterium sp. TaxID=1573823 RepID=UPI0029C75BE6|nr:SusD/RagB family nutrient-binding outer membrane lipoprotein [uncultured Draconibacterium sp.]